MKKLVFVPIALLAFPSAALAGENNSLTKCLKDCVQAINHAISDSGDDEQPIVSDFTQQDCINWCEEIEYEDCGFWADACCLPDPDFLTSDPDCGELPAGNACTDDIQCASDDCDITEGETVGICVDDVPSEVETVVSTTGEVWMDRNLGASRVATSMTDTEAYGDLYQWGRGTDGHQIRTSPTTSILSSTDEPGHDNFITVADAPYDWRLTPNNKLWQGESGINNPCPAGFRLPTNVELLAETEDWSTHNLDGAYASPLKLVAAGGRMYYDGTLFGEGTWGIYLGLYWSSTVVGQGRDASDLTISSYNATTYADYRADGFSVRCIED